MIGVPTVKVVTIFLVNAANDPAVTTQKVVTRIGNLLGLTLETVTVVIASQEVTARVMAKLLSI
jgi:hypothetical protein